MEQYIKKSDIIAEIDRRIKVLQNHPMETHKTICHLDSLKQSLNMLEAKEADLYEELDVYFAQFKGLEKSYWNWRIDNVNIHAQGIYDFAKHFFELGLKVQKGE